MVFIKAIHRRWMANVRICSRTDQSMMHSLGNGFVSLCYERHTIFLPKGRIYLNEYLIIKITIWKEKLVFCIDIFLNNQIELRK